MRPQSRRALVLPLLCALGLAAFGALPAARQNARLMWAFLAAAAVLLLWNVVLLAAANRRGRTFHFEIVARKQHYLQACAQGVVFLYWGWYWRPVYDSAALVAAQLLFAYAFDMLLSWSRRDTYTLGFGPFPVIFSINLFLWFKEDWFYLQLVLVAVGFAAKELIQWDKEGRRAHIFNPSSFPLAVFSLALIVAHSNEITWGPAISQTQFYPPLIYVVLFLVGLPGQFFFGVAPMTMSAVVTTYLFGLLYFATTGTYFFITNDIPAAMFLGMHLLFTDPSTAPRTELGRIIFGAMYGIGCITSYALLSVASVPTFYDKLLPVPILNLSIKLIDRMARSNMLTRFDPFAIWQIQAPRARNLAYISVWSVIFAVMSSATLADTHPGQSAWFWEQACDQGRRNACEELESMESAYCRQGSAWACNEHGILLVEKRLDPWNAARSFQRACGLGSSAACTNASRAATGAGLDAASLVSSPPRAADYLVLLQQGKGAVRERDPLALYERACEQGWLAGCDSLGMAHLRGEGTWRDPVRAVREFEKACDRGWAPACANVGFMYWSADGVLLDRTLALRYLDRACALGMPKACTELQQLRD